MLTKEIKNAYIRNYINMVIDEFLIYKKYFNINEFNYEHIVNGARDEVILTDKEKKKLIEQSKEILKSKYGIEITNDNPIVIKEVN